MRQYVLSGYLNGILRNANPRESLPKTVLPEDTGQTLDYLLEHLPGRVEVAALDVAVKEAKIWLWYVHDGHTSHQQFVPLESHVAAELLAPPPTPEHEAEQPHPYEVD